MKRSVFFILFFVFLCFAAYSQSNQKENPTTDFNYNKYEGNITITNYIGEPKDVVIPEKIDGLPAVAIEFGALARNRLTSVVIPNSVEIIKDKAFDINVIITRE